MAICSSCEYSYKLFMAPRHQFEDKYKIDIETLSSTYKIRSKTVEIERGKKTRNSTYTNTETVYLALDVRNAVLAERKLLLERTLKKNSK